MHPKKFSMLILILLGFRTIAPQNQRRRSMVPNSEYLICLSFCVFTLKFLIHARFCGMLYLCEFITRSLSLHPSELAKVWLLIQKRAKRKPKILRFHPFCFLHLLYPFSRETRVPARPPSTVQPMRQRLVAHISHALGSRGME